MISLDQWLIATAASWYLAYSITQTHGPFGVFDAIRLYLPLGGLTACIICLIFWIALIIVWLLTGRLLPLEALAVAGVALWVHGYTSWRMNL